MTESSDLPPYPTDQLYSVAGANSWRNGETVASGEAYESKANALKGVEAVQRAAAGASVDDIMGE